MSFANLIRTTSQIRAALILGQRAVHVVCVLHFSAWKPDSIKSKTVISNTGVYKFLTCIDLVSARWRIQSELMKMPCTRERKNCSSFEVLLSILVDSLNPVFIDGVGRVMTAKLKAVFGMRTLCTQGVLYNRCMLFSSD